MMSMKKIVFVIFLMLTAAGAAWGQEQTVQNRPYIDLRPFHFGLLVGTHLQDIEFNNMGPQTIIANNGSQQTYTITCDQSQWDNGFQVGVLGEARLTEHFQFRVAPAILFGSRHIEFHNMDAQAPDSMLHRSQDLKTIYFTCSFDLIAAAPRMGNHRPYAMLGLTPAINLTGSDNSYIKLKRYDMFLEAGFGCDFYMPFFKVRPELKFMYSLTNSLDKDHADRLQDEAMRPYALSVNKARSKVIALTLYFE